MKTIEDLDGTLNEEGTFEESGGVLSSAVWEHSDEEGWFLHTAVGYGGVKVWQGATAVAITLEELLELAMAKEPDLAPQLPTPSATPSSGATPIEVTLACEEAGATIYYTTDGNDPTEDDDEYSAPISLTQACTLKAKAFKEFWQPSAVRTCTYT
jgi:hypothetical protein